MTKKQRFIHYWTATGVIPRWQLFSIYTLVTTVCVIGFIKIGNVADSAHRTATKTAKLQRANRKLTLTIQSQRVSTLFDTCADQNRRHDSAVKTTLQILVHPVVPQQPPLTKRQIAAQRKFILQWVNAIVPRRNCEDVVQSATSP